MFAMTHVTRTPWLPIAPAIMAAVLSLSVWVLPTLGDEPSPTQPAAPHVDFVRDIRPIFENNCYQCHNAAKHKGGLRLDGKATAFIGGDSGEASIVPHQPDKSKLIQLVRGDDPNAVMPPKGKRLSSDQVELLSNWVKQGAAWPDGVDKPGEALTHWSFSKPLRPAIPQVKNTAWPHNPIDSFVLAKLEQQGLGASPEADRFTLCRRLYLDLIGLPPSPSEVDEFVNEKSPDAYEKLVDRLMANPHFGERWARHWLDLARYADSAGYGSDPLRKTCFRYRDWLINAFNQDEPFDRFTIEQLAGDLLPNPTTDQLIATAFHRNTMTNTEGGTDREEFRTAAVKDRTDTTLQTWMGVTMGCAQCHSHKYDPITNREYYQVFAIFNQTEDADRPDEAPTIETPTPQEATCLASLKTRIGEAETKLNNPAEWVAAEAKWEKTLASQHTNWTVLNPSELSAASGATLTRQPDGAVIASGTRSQTDVYTITAGTDLKGITAFRLEALPDESLPHGGPGRQDNGGFVLSNFKVSVTPRQSAPVQGRFVRIELPGKKRILHLAEVQAFHGSENLALKGKARQSSTAFGGDAKFAIDGETDGNFEKHRTSHTDDTDNPWWEVDLGRADELDRIKIWNRTDNGWGKRLSNFRVIVLDEKRRSVWETEIDAPPDPSLDLELSGPRTIVLGNASESFYQTEGGEWTAAKAANPRNTDAGWAVGPKVGVAHSAVFESAHDVGSGSAATLTFTLTQNSPFAPLGRFRISATTDPRPVRVLPESVSEALAVAADSRTEAHKAALFDYFRAVSPEANAQRQQIAKLKKDLEDVHPATTAIMREVPPDKRRDCHVLVKGNFLNKGAVVEPTVPAAFNPLPKDAPHNRLGLALWLVDRDNPLTARVEVNRLWAQLFGVGIVETQEDFGTQGTPPSNQPLLDWMAVEFMEPSTSADRPWDMKRMVKLMVTAATYRQTSRVTTELLERDPNNRLFSRGPRKRLEAELVRDQALALSGLLSPKMFGPSVYPPQPDGLWQAAFNGERTYPTSTGEDRYRRGVYTFWRRTVPYPSMAAFDAPSREVCTLRRIPTSTPLQAFVTLNDPVYVECAEALARRVMTEGGATTQDRAKYALKLCLGRPPEDQQAQRLIALHDREVEHYRQDEKAAVELASSERGPLPPGMWSADAAAWTVCANVLLNMDGVLVKR
jgi:mono/diheme cytochrome c family protein